MPLKATRTGTAISLTIGEPDSVDDGVERYTAPSDFLEMDTLSVHFSTAEPVAYVDDTFRMGVLITSSAGTVYAGSAAENFRALEYLVNGVPRPDSGGTAVGSCLNSARFPFGIS